MARQSPRALVTITSTPSSALLSTGFLADQAGVTVLTPKGLRVLIEAARQEEDKPVWDAEARKLRWRGDVILKLLRDAENQGAILAAFEARDWVGRIGNPLPPDEFTDAKARLRDAVKSLMRNVLRGTIRFRMDGSGCGVFWERAETERIFLGSPVDQSRNGR